MLNQDERRVIRPKMLWLIVSNVAERSGRQKDVTRFVILLYL